jgi:spore germination cell wall hydrolase CwlJ-like protein
MKKTVSLLLGLAIAASLNGSHKLQPQRKPDERIVPIRHFPVEFTVPVVKAETKPSYSQYEFKLISKLLMEEGGNQPRNGKIAILNVLENRKLTGHWGDTYEDVIFAPKQFSCIRRNIAYNHKLIQRKDAYKNFYNATREPNAECKELTILLLTGKLKRVVGKDIIYYYNRKKTNDKWIVSRGGIKIGDHHFAK